MMFVFPVDTWIARPATRAGSAEKFILDGRRHSSGSVPAWMLLFLWVGNYILEYVQEAVAVTTAIQEEIFQEMGVGEWSWYMDYMNFKFFHLYATFFFSLQINTSSV